MSVPRWVSNGLHKGASYELNYHLQDGDFSSQIL